MCHFINDAITHCSSHASRVYFLGKILSSETAGSESMHRCKGFCRDGRILSRKFLIIPVLTAHANMEYHHLLEIGEEEGREGHRCSCVFLRIPKPLSSAAGHVLRVATCPCSAAFPFPLCSATLLSIHFPALPPAPQLLQRAHS